MVCGNGGASNITLYPKSYQIVVPAILYFIALIIFSAYEVSFIADGIQQFCIHLRNESGLTNDSCSELFHEFTRDVGVNVTESHSDLLLNNTAVNYPLTMVVLWSALVGFCLGFFVMILRCLFVVDFELVKVTVKSEERPMLDPEDGE